MEVSNNFSKSDLGGALQADDRCLMLKGKQEVQKSNQGKKKILK